VIMFVVSRRGCPAPGFLWQKKRQSQECERVRMVDNDIICIPKVPKGLLTCLYEVLLRPCGMPQGF